jgi:hypothetical protein
MQRDDQDMVAFYRRVAVSPLSIISWSISMAHTNREGIQRTWPIA